MKLNRLSFLIFILVIVVILIPSVVNASVDTMKIVVDDPQEGYSPDTTAIVTFFDKDEDKHTMEVEVEWANVTDGNWNSISASEKFIKDNKYMFQFTTNSKQDVEDVLSTYGASLSVIKYIYYNGNLYNDGLDFYIGGLKKFTIDIEELIVGNSFPETAKFIVEKIDGTQEFEVDIVNWEEKTEDGEKTLDFNALVENNKEYAPIFVFNGEQESIMVELLKLMDIRTKFDMNGENIIDIDERVWITASEEIYKVTFDANTGFFDKESIYIIEDWNPYRYDSLKTPTKDGYVFKGYYTEKSGGIKFEMLLNEAGIDRDMTFYAQWEKELVNPKTLDNIEISVFIGIFSLIGLIGSALYLNKINKVRA